MSNLHAASEATRFSLSSSKHSLAFRLRKVPFESFGTRLTSTQHLKSKKKKPWPLVRHVRLPSKRPTFRCTTCTHTIHLRFDDKACYSQRCTFGILNLAYDHAPLIDAAGRTQEERKKRKRERRYLSLIADEVDFGLAGLRGCLCRQDNIGRFLGLLHEHVDQRLLLVRLWQWRQLRRGWRRWRGRLNEDDFVVFLRRLRQRQLLGWFILRRFRWWHMDVHMLVDHRVLLRWPITIGGRPITSGYSATPAGWGEV